jgi:predicted MPP superfamily phosphohydrolase
MRARFSWLLLLFLWTCNTVIAATAQKAKPVLKLRETEDGGYEFVILQIADIHLGEAASEDWGPEQDRKTFIALDRCLGYEATPDLIVLTGDQLTANNVDSNATTYYELLAEKLSEYNVPWALIFGNHDDAPLDPPHGYVTTSHMEDEHAIPTSKTSRMDLVLADQQFENSLTEYGPKELFGTSNYWLSIYDAVLPDVVAARIVMFDSGGGSLPQQITDDQIDWFWQRYAEYPQHVPIFAFQHIPSTISDFAYDDSKCFGTHIDGATPLEHDAGIVNALAQAGNVYLLGVGHDHESDYCCPYNDM